MLIDLQAIEAEEDKSKFEDIYGEYRGLMYYVAYKRLHHEQDAEDAVHYAFMKIAENIKIIDPVSPKTKQLFVTIVDNRVTDMLRMNGRLDCGIFCFGSHLSRDVLQIFEVLTGRAADRFNSRHGLLEVSRFLDGNADTGYDCATDRKRSLLDEAHLLREIRR